MTETVYWRSGGLMPYEGEKNDFIINNSTSVAINEVEIYSHQTWLSGVGWRCVNMNQLNIR